MKRLFTFAYARLTAAFARLVVEITAGLHLLARDPAAALDHLLTAVRPAAPRVSDRPSVRAFTARRMDRPDVGGYSPGFASAL